MPVALPTGMQQVVFTVLLVLQTTLTWAQDTARGSESQSNRPRLTEAQKINIRELSNLASGKMQNDVSSYLLKVGDLKNPLIKTQCIEGALASVTANHVNNFIYCDPNTKQILAHQEEPYPTEEYRRLLQNSFELTTSCLKGYVAETDDLTAQNAWAEFFFKKVSIESGFHPYLKSDGGAHSSGQLLPIYTQDFAKLTFDDVRNYLTRNGAPAPCKYLAEKLLTKERIDGLFTNGNKSQFKTCANMGITDGKPILNMIIAFSHLKSYKQQIMGEMKKLKNYSQATSLLSTAEILELEIKTTAVGYSIGSTKARNLFTNVLISRYQNRKITTVNDFLDTAKVLKTGYLYALKERYNDVLRRAGTSSCRAR